MKRTLTEKLAWVYIVAVVAVAAWAATPTSNIPISQMPVATNLLESAWVPIIQPYPGRTTNDNFKVAASNAFQGRSVISATNLYVTNLYVSNFYAGTTILTNTFITNFYASNIYATNITATYITNYFATMDTTIINTLTANYFYAYSYIVNTNYGIWTNDNSAYPYSIVHILDEIPYSYVAMSNTLIKGTESVLSKSQVLALGTNVLESGTRSQFLLISPTNDAAQVVIELNGGTNTVQKLEIYNLTNASPALGAFTLVANSTVPDSLAGGLVKLREGQNWVATNGAWIELRFVSPDWIEMDRGTLATPGQGITINPTDGYLPYRSNATTFGNSPISRVNSNTARITAGPAINAMELSVNATATSNLDHKDSPTLNVIGSIWNGAAAVSREGKVYLLGYSGQDDRYQLLLTTGNGQIWADSGGDVYLGQQSALPTNSTSGFASFRAMAGLPTGVVPGAPGQVAMTYDTSSNLFYIYNAGWHNIGGGSGTIINPGDLYFPVRSNATEFVDGPVHLDAAASTNVVLDGGIYFGSGLTNALYKTGEGLAYTNGGTANFELIGGSASGHIGTGSGCFTVMSDAACLLFQNSTKSFHFTGTDVMPNSTDLNIGADGVPWNNLWATTLTLYGYNAGADYNRLYVSHAGTNTGVIFNIQSAGAAAAAVPVTFTNQSTVVIAGTTNVVTFGGTNTVPADTTNIATWVSVMVTGDTNAYRLPLYK